MPNGYGYGGGRGRGGYSANYRYQQPAAAQYESFFNPIPIDFLQQNLAQHQQQYDVAFQGALAAKEKALQEEIALGDSLYRKDLVEGSMKEMDRITQEKYGGDYGRAAKDIARQVTDLRANPFWASSKHLKEQQQIQQKYQLENPDAWIYGDVMNIGAVDPEGNIRSPEELTFRAEKHGDWDKSAQGIIASMTADQFADGLSDEEFSMLSAGHYGGISDKKIQEILDNPSVMRSFIANNPDFKNAFEAGLSYQEFDNVEDAAKDFLEGHLRPTKFYKEQRTYMRDFEEELELKARLSADDAASGIVISGSGDYVQMHMDQPEQASKHINQMQKQISGMQDSPKKRELQAELGRAVEVREHMMHRVQTSDYAVDINRYYDEYKDWIEKNYTKNSAIYKSLNYDDFEEEVFESIRQGDLPDKDTFVDPFESDLGVNKAFNWNNAARTAGRKMVNAMGQMADEGKIAQNVNVLIGETGAERKDTYVGRMNETAQKMWDANTGWTIPYSNRQIEDVLKEDKRYKGWRNREKRDPTKDEIFMTDGFMEGKPVMQLVIRSKTGTKLGSEYIVPDDPASIQANMTNAGFEMYNSTDPNKRAIGETILSNTTYQPAIQEAAIYSNPEGTFDKRISFKGKPVTYERIVGGGIPGFELRTGEGDYYTATPEQAAEMGVPIDPTTGRLQPQTETQIQQVLMIFEADEARKRALAAQQAAQNQE